jgi:peptide methionine sulfoxide reductase msrA/msrB
MRYIIQVLLGTSIIVLVAFTLWYQSQSSTQSMQNNRTNNSITPTVPTDTLLLAGGCFWCVEADLEKLPGVIAVVSGYAGGTTDNPTYETYHAGGHREVVEVTYDPIKVTFEEILIYAMKHMDPTDGEGSFFDRGQYYAPAFYYETAEEKTLIENLIAEVNAQGPYKKPLAIAVEARSQFWPAEAYHQDYYKGTLSGVKYQYYRAGSGRDKFIQENWGDDTGPDLPWRVGDDTTSVQSVDTTPAHNVWASYQKPDASELKNTLSPLAYKVTQSDGTEPPYSSEYDKFWEAGIYVDILSGEPLFSSKDKFDSGTGWPSFVKPITPVAVSEHEDRRLFSVRTEIRSAIADNHLGHVFPDGPEERGGLRYCMNGVALRFVPLGEMEEAGYGAYLSSVQ